MILYYQVLRNTRLLAEGEIETPFQIGRQNEFEASLKPVCVNELGDERRLVITPISTDLNVPRKAVSVDAAGANFVVKNIRPNRAETDVKLSDNRVIRSGEIVTVNGETALVFDGGLVVRIKTNRDLPAADLQEHAAGDERFRSLADGPSFGGYNQLERSLMDLPQNAQSDAVDLVKKALRPFNEVPGTAKFYTTVVNSVKEMIDVDRAVVLVRGPNGWTQKASSQIADSKSAVGMETQDSSAQELTRYSRSLVDRVVRTQQTEIVEPVLSANMLAASMRDIQRAVAAPIFDENRKIVAILYADKRFGGAADRPISLLQASLLDVIANAVSAGLMRQREAEFRTAAGQFFSKGVLDRLRSQKDLLEGRDTEVSILFCDIRGFSTVAHRAGPAETIKWINEVLTCLSECVLNQDGVVVDYVGDALMAMFGAPEPQSDHADRACRAACEMLRLVPVLKERYKQLVQEKFGIGIGINSGQARVGNTGSRVKYKYGPLGNTVNMASRIEGLTKHVGVSGLMTGTTKEALADHYLSRRLSAVRVVGIPEPVELFEVQPDDSLSNQDLFARYAEALVCYERQETAEALGLLARIVKEWPIDYPSQLLLKRTAACFGQTNPFDPVWTMSQK